MKEMKSKIDELHSNGYTILNSIVDEDIIYEARSICKRIIENKESLSYPLISSECDYTPHDFSSGGLLFVYQRHPTFQKITHSDPLHQFCQKLFAKGAFMWRNAVVYKQEVGENKVPWHRDVLEPMRSCERIITWVPLRDVDRSTGCLKIAEGTYGSNFEDTDIQNSVIRNIDMKAGDALIMRADLLHSSDEVKDGTCRFAYSMAIDSIEKEVEHPYDSNPIMISRNKNLV